MSEKTVAAKLLIKPESTVWLSAPEQQALLEPLPAGTALVARLDEASHAVFFAASAAAIRELLTTEQADLLHPTVLWVAYQKGNRADINRDSLWPIVADFGLRPVTQVAIDAVWSALRFRPLKAGETQFTGGRAGA